MVGKRQLAAQALCASGISSILGRIGAWHGVIAFAYHRVTDSEETIFDPGVWSATSEEFARQVRYIRRNCDVIRPDEIKGCVGNKHGRFALITFDDGYRDNYEVAFRILDEEHVPGVFFVTSDFVDHPHLSWWDEIAWMIRNARCNVLPPNEWLAESVSFMGDAASTALNQLLRRYKQLPGKLTNDYLDFLGEALGCGRFNGDCEQVWMTWDMLREMQQAGMCIGGHTTSHPVLARLPAADQSRELAHCKSRLECELHTPMICMSYPVGGRDAFNADTRECLSRLQVPWAFSYYGGQFDLGHLDPYDLPRVAIERDTTMSMLAAIIALPRVFA